MPEPRPTEPVPSPDGTYSGYFVIADISGYTGFLANNELAHAQGILSELTTLLIDALGPPFRFVELEGDAVFVYAPAAAVNDPEVLVEIVEVAYAKFQQCIARMAANTSCVCSACAAIESLDLKCVAHAGDFVPQATPKGTKLVGPDVILVHRLLKNRVIESTGVRAYAFFTDAFLVGATLAQEWLGLPAHTEEYAELGSVQGRVLDLRRAVERYREATREFVAVEDADILIEVELSEPPSVLWPYFVDADLRLRWQLDTVSVENRFGGHDRIGVGVESHCDHGSYRLNHRIIDFQPFHYITMHTVASGRSIKKPPSSYITFEFEELDGGRSRVWMRFRAVSRNPVRVGLIRLLKSLPQREFEGHFAVLEKTLADDRRKIAAAEA